MNEEEINKKIPVHLKRVYIEYSKTFCDTNIEDLKDSCEVYIQKINDLKEKENGQIWSVLDYSEHGIDINIYRRETDEEYITRIEKQSINSKIFNRKQALQILKDDEELLNKIKSNVDINTMLINLNNG